MQRADPLSSPLPAADYTYECTNKELPYKPRPSRTQQLLSGKAAAPRDKPSVETPAEFLPKYVPPPSVCAALR